MIPNSNKIHEIFLDCLPKEHGGPDDPKPCIFVEGLQQVFAFDPQKIEMHLTEIKEMLDDLDPEFHEENGGGMSFLKMPFTKDDKQWGEQFSARELMELSIAMGYMQYLMPREFWAALPGGVPYVVILKDRKEKEAMSFKEYQRRKNNG